MSNKLIDRLYEMSKAYSDRIALVGAGRSINYKDMICHVSDMAEKLINKGVNKGDICAVICDRNIHTVISIFAIWAIGGVYLPINLENPDNRNDFIIANSGAKVIIDTTRNSNCKSNFIDKYGFMLLKPDDTVQRTQPLKSVNVSEQEAAYILFTSGSTGTPKGVKISVGNLLNLLQGLESSIYCQFAGNLNIGLVAPFTFDVSIQQITAALLLGHTLHITQDSQRKDPNKLFKFIIRHNINIYDCTPTHIKMLNGTLQDKSIKKHPLKCIIVGGEALKGETIKSFTDKFDCKSPFIVNMYGVTECTVDSVYHFFDPDEMVYPDQVPIGIPMDGVMLAVVNKSTELVADGEQGELCIGGLGVGLGYLDEDLNRKSFTHIDAYPGRLFYKTGDIVRTDGRGRFICLGRNDRQVKVRGNRIELDEIEACIMRYNHLPAKKIICTKCLLDSNAVDIDQDGICQICHFYERNVDKFDNVFGKLNDFRTAMERIRLNNTAKYDCMLLYSGGKDSTYVLVRLKEFGYRVLAYTFDNGYLSEQAFDNIRNITNALGTDSVIEKFPKMDEVFSESIRKYHTVCDGCYKVLASLSTKYAIKNHIPAIITGLDRGQIIETKLKGLLDQGIMSDMEQYLNEQRKIYHYWDDHFSSLVGTPGEPADIDKLSFFDFFFYEKTNEAKILDYLQKKQIWKKCHDTGLCSTNCRMNDVGTDVYYRANGFHNYAAPLSWQVRLNEITREEGLKKLSTDHFDHKYIHKVLNHFGIHEKIQIEDCYAALIEEKLYVFLVSSNEPDTTKVLSYLRNELPSYMIPHRIIVLPGFPVTENGKLDHAALALLAKEDINDNEEKNKDPVIMEVIDIWRKILGHSDFGINDSFFDIGGDSLEAIMISSEIKTRFNCLIPFQEIVEKFTITGIANQIKTR